MRSKPDSRADLPGESLTDPRPLDLASLNSATKYPSIPTHHALGERGLLREEVTQYSGAVMLTEKYAP